VTYHKSNIKARQQPEAAPDTISILELSRGIQYNHLTFGIGSAQLNTTFDYNQANGRFSMSYVTGTHSLKLGLSALHGVENNVNITIPNDMQYQFFSGVPVSLTQFATPGNDKNTLGLNLGLFAQDRWTVRKVTLSLGVRFDYLNAFVPAQTRPGGQFVDTFQFGRIKNVPNWKDLNPRLGMAYDLMGNGRTALKVSLGRYVTAQATSIAKAVNPANAIVTQASRTWTDANRNFVPDCNLHNIAANGECGALSDSGFGTIRVLTRYDADVLQGFGVREYNWQTTASIQHELRPGWSAELGYFRTFFGNFLVTDNLLITPADYDPYSIAAPADPRLPGGGGNRIAGLYDINPAKFGRSDLLITSAKKYGDQKEIYNGVDLRVNGRVGGSTVLGGGLSVGRPATDNCFVVDSPQQARSGFCNVTPPWSAGTEFKFNGSYQLPFDSQVSWVFQNLPGIAKSANYSASNSEIAPSLGRSLAAGTDGRVTIDILPPQSQFEERQMQIDLRFTKIVPVGKGRIRGWVDLYNVFNANTVLGVVGRLGPTWLLPTSVLGGRLVKFGGQLDF
jgi:hypothetical protein